MAILSKRFKINIIFSLRSRLLLKKSPMLSKVSYFILLKSSQPPLETKIAEENAPADAPKAEEGSSVDPEAADSEAKPKKERVFKKKHVLTRNGLLKQ